MLKVVAWCVWQCLPSALDLRNPQSGWFELFRPWRELGVVDGLRAALVDPMTGLYNRRYAIPHLAHTLRQSALSGASFAVMMADLDHFKRINDMFGHDTGDEVLIAVAEGLKQENVFPARQGGEEFVVLIYGEDYQRLAETVRRQITLSVLEKVPEVPFPVTASAGLTEVRPNDTLDSAVKRGDEALYAAKDAGRDQLLLWQDGKHSQPRLVHGV